MWFSYGHRRRCSFIWFQWRWKSSKCPILPPPRGGYAGALRAPARGEGGGDWALRIFHLHWNRGGALPPFLWCPVMYHEGISKGRSPISKGCLKFVCCLSPAALLKVSGSTEIWTRIAGFRVLSANHYTIEPWHGERRYFFSLVFVLAFFRVWYCGKERHHTFNFFMRKLFVSCFSETQWTVYSRGGFWYFLNLFANSFRYCLLF